MYTITVCTDIITEHITELLCVHTRIIKLTTGVATDTLSTLQ